MYFSEAYMESEIFNVFCMIVYNNIGRVMCILSFFFDEEKMKREEQDICMLYFKYVLVH